MSAFVISRETMQVVVTALRDPNNAAEDADKLGRDLFALNERAVEWRYNQEADAEPSSYADWIWRVASPLLDGYGAPVYRKTACEWVKALHCLRYQLSEGEPFETHSLYLRIQQRIRELESGIVHNLPEYDAAPWDCR